MSFTGFNLSNIHNAKYASRQIKYIYYENNLIWPLNPLPYEQQYLTFEALDDTTFTCGNANAQYSLDNGATWTTLNAGTNSPTVYRGRRIMWKYTIPQSTWTHERGVCYFTSTGRFDVFGNIMSLLYGDNFYGEYDLTGKDWIFFATFSGCNIVNASNLILPATTLSKHCYEFMLDDCYLLTGAPTLPATTLADYCYYGLFDHCLSLTNAPALPATTLANHCYNGMFMYTNIKTAPLLPATTLADYCYYLMFFEASQLNYVKCLATDISATSCTTRWLDGVASSGTFVKDANTTWPSGYSGIPANWTTQNV